MKILDIFFNCFIPKLLGGTRSDGAYSTRRLTFVGSITFLVFLSSYCAVVFTVKNDSGSLLDLIDRWVFIVVISGVLVTMSGSLNAITELLKLLINKK